MSTQDSIKKIEELRPKWPDNSALQAFDAVAFESLSTRMQWDLLRCMRSGIENPDSSMGAYAGCKNDYRKFPDFFGKLITAHHGTSADTKHISGWNFATEEKLDLNALELPPLSVRIRVGRNLAGHPFPSTMSKEGRLQLESQVAEALLNSSIDGRFVSLSPSSPHKIDEASYRGLIENHLMFKPIDKDPYLISAGIANDWPHGRGAFISNDHSFLVWIGEEDHLRIMVMEKTSNLSDLLTRFHQRLDEVESILDVAFSQHADWGYLTSCPTNLGTGMRASVHLRLTKLTEGGSDERVRDLAAPLGLAVRGLGGEHTAVGKDGTVDISPKARFAITEVDIMRTLFRGIGKLQAAEAAA